jgi:hypothetical protein
MVPLGKQKFTYESTISFLCVHKSLHMSLQKVYSVYTKSTNESTKSFHLYKQRSTNESMKMVPLGK